MKTGKQHKAYPFYTHCLHSPGTLRHHSAGWGTEGADTYRNKGENVLLGFCLCVVSSGWVFEIS